MAAASGVLTVLTEERFLCSVCLDVFTEPVSTPCGHNFCRACIHKYWDSNDSCQCPLCKRTFPTRPALQVNTVMSESAGEFKRSVQLKASTPDPQLAADVFCDICSETKEKAVKSCLMCLTSFCEAHLKPHHRVAGLRSHTLLNPTKHLDDKLCKTHNKITELFCRDDQACVCVLCLKSDHKGHNVVPLEEEYETVMAKTDEAIATIQKQIQSRSEKVAEIENSLDVCQKEAEKEKDDGVQLLTDLISSFQRSQAELVEVINGRHRAAKEKAEASVKELKMEITELECKRNQLEQLEQSEDHHYFLQSFPTLSSPLKTDCANIVLQCDLPLEAVREDVALLKRKADELLEKLPEIKMKRMREHAVDLTLDPDTAHCSLAISQDGKQVTNRGTKLDLPDNPKRFEKFSEILAKEGFTTGKFYFEVQVKEKTGWTIGVVRESVDRKNDTNMSAEGGFWTFRLDKGKYFQTGNKTVKLKDHPQKVGVFVDYNKGMVAFYDVDSKSHLSTVTGYNFTEKLYPYFCPNHNENGKNAAPLIITPVPQSN